MPESVRETKSGSGKRLQAQVELGLGPSQAKVGTVGARLGMGRLAGTRMVFVQAPRRRAAPIGGRVLAEKQTVAVFSPSPPPPGNTRGQHNAKAGPGRWTPKAGFGDE